MWKMPGNSFYFQKHWIFILFPRQEKRQTKYVKLPIFGPQEFQQGFISDFWCLFLGRIVSQNRRYFSLLKLYPFVNHPSSQTSWSLEPFKLFCLFFLQFCSNFRKLTANLKNDYFLKCSHLRFFCLVWKILSNCFYSQKPLKMWCSLKNGIQSHILKISHSDIIHTNISTKKIYFKWISSVFNLLTHTKPYITINAVNVIFSVNSDWIDFTKMESVRFCTWKLGLPNTFGSIL